MSVAETESSKMIVRITDGPINIESLLTDVGDPDVGAHGWFFGVTRRKTTRGDTTKITQSLSYEAHRPMAISELEKLAAKALADFQLKHIVIVHRLGDVPVGQASVVLGCSSAHRVATFRANEWIMNTLKQDVPIWKRETYSDGSTQWVHPIESDGPTS
ncbi:molybdenum cofactor biosynthesis protein MoaE [Stieleria marina]|uniref:Molybdopterin synthase catalytic subunit n=1 Tax=Stieleria marina TaxID=1930275 RepID=A0A517NWT8_9BACT|nr:Molybdopterin synthase catalytic subunit [Planctomycetes bacterium K23_9]